METTLITIARAIQALDGRALLVGGAVRDGLLGLPPKDFDTEVYGLPADTLARLLADFGKVDAVGVNFGVLKLHTPQGEEFDFSLPRRDSKAAPGHRGFVTTPDHGMTIREAASRRDYTVNSMARDPLTGELFDPFAGRQHLAWRWLVATSRAYLDDPLRPLRGLQQAGRFRLFCPDAPTVRLARTAGAEYSYLAAERIRDEWLKWAGKSVAPAFGLRWLEQIGWLQFYPELAALPGCPQEPEFHPEGDAWRHTVLATDAAAQLAATWSEDCRAPVIMAALLHDLGKPQTTVREHGRIQSPGHAEAGVPLAAQFLARIHAPGADAALARLAPPAELHQPPKDTFAERVLVLVREHMTHLTGAITPRLVRRLADRLYPATISELLAVIEADYAARPPLPGGLPAAAQAIQAEAERQALLTAAPKDILTGKLLLEQRIITPGPQMGALLHAARQAQLDGHFTDTAGALAWARSAVH